MHSGFFRALIGAKTFSVMFLFYW